MTEVTPSRSGLLEAGDKRIYWELFGSGDREAVCLLNGLAMSTSSWYSFLSWLADDYDVLLYDYPGQGRSTSRDEPCLIPGLARYLEGVVDALEIRRIHLMGISYGGFVALDFARLYQERLLTLTLSGIILSHEELFQMYQELSLRFYRGGPELLDLYTHYMYEKIFGEAFVRRARPHLEGMRQKFFERYRDRIHSLVRLTEAQIPFFAQLDENLTGYRAIQTPTLMLAGAEDRVMLPRAQRKICDILPNSRFELIEDSGHVVYLEQAEAFFGRLKRFLATRHPAS